MTEFITPELNKAMIAALSEMPPLTLDAKNPFLKNKYASLGEVLKVAKPILFKHGLCAEQQPYDRDGKIGIRTIIRHVSGESSASEFAVDVTNEKGLSGAQCAGSIITYLRRYTLSARFGLYADEDTDGNAPISSTDASRSVPERKKVPEPVQAPKSNPGAITGQSAYDNVPKDELWFLKVIVPVPHRGQRRDEYLRNPDTIGSLYDLRHEPGDIGQNARERLWGFVNNYEPKGWVKRNGEHMPPSEGDIQFRKALDAFADYLEKQPGEEQL